MSWKVCSLLELQLSKYVWAVLPGARYVIPLQNRLYPLKLKLEQRRIEQEDGFQQS